MLLTLLRHQLKEGLRSKVWQKNAFLNGLMIFFFLYLLGNFATIGFVADIALQKIFPGKNPYTYINSILFYYFLASIFLRYYFQELPAVSIQHYLHLPIKRSRLIRYLLIRSKFNLFNFGDLVLFIPIYLRMLANNYSVTEALPWLIGVFGFIGMINFFVLYFKRLLSFNWKIATATAAAYLGIIALDYYDFVSLMDASEWFFMQFLEGAQYLIVLPLLGTFLFYFLLQRKLIQFSYLGSLVSMKKAKEASESKRLNFLSRFGTVGELIALEGKLILRHKRTRSVLIMSLAFTLYGLFFYPQESYIQNDFMLIFVGLMVTGMFLLNYGQFIFSWESSHYDHLLTSKIDPVDYVRAKFWLFATACTANLVLSLPYVYFGSNVLLVNLSLWALNVGVTGFIVMVFGSISPGKLDLNNGSAFNWQGVKAAQFLLSFPVFIIPIAIYGVAAFWGNSQLGIYLIGVLGVIGILTSRFWIKLIAKRINDKKYSISSSFREG